MDKTHIYGYRNQIAEPLDQIISGFCVVDNYTQVLKLLQKKGQLPSKPLLKGANGSRSVDIEDTLRQMWEACHTISKGTKQLRELLYIIDKLDPDYEKKTEEIRKAFEQLNNI